MRSRERIGNMISVYSYSDHDVSKYLAFLVNYSSSYAQVRIGGGHVFKDVKV